MVAYEIADNCLLTSRDSVAIAVESIRFLIIRPIPFVSQRMDQILWNEGDKYYFYYYYYYCLLQMFIYFLVCPIQLT